MKHIVYQLFIFLICVLWVYSGVEAQNLSSRYVINWQDYSPDQPKELKAGQETFPRFLPEKFGNLPLVVLKIPVTGPNNSITINPLITEQEQQLSIEDQQHILPEIWIKHTTVYEKKQAWLVVTMLPYFKSNATVYKVKEYEIQTSGIQSLAQQASIKRNYGSNSVLSSGDWYKIAVKDEGIYKLSYNFLKTIGVDIDRVDPRNIRLYGNGGSMLPQKNSAIRVDDLFENAIEVIGEADQKFDPSDYLLFYAEGNVKWKYNPGTSDFFHERNTYSDTSYYFLNTGSVPGKRIQSVSENNLEENVLINYYDDLQLHENDSYTLISETLKSGREWYGENFEFNNIQNFQFAIDGTEPNSLVNIRTDMAIRSNQNTNAQLKVNNVLVSTLAAAAVPLNFETQFARSVTSLGSYQLNSANFNLTLTYNKPNSSSNAWLNFIELNSKKLIQGNRNSVRFRSVESVGIAKVSKFNITNLKPTSQVWNVTNGLLPVRLALTNTGFKSRTEILKEFILFSDVDYKEPQFIAKVLNQNLHALPQTDMVIISPPDFLSEARRLATHRKSEQNINTHIVTPEQVYNEFSSGARDAGAIRDFMKMFYDRAGNNNALLPKYLLLLGDGSFDNRKINFKQNNTIVTYQSYNSLSPTSSYTSDDYFGLLDDNEGEFPEDFVTSPGLLDIAVGRIPAKTVDEARNVIDKLIRYSAPSSLGEWRNELVILADDEDNNIHLNQAEANASIIQQRNKNINISKIYFDAYTQESTASGTRYPQVKEAINQKINAGILMLNYTGHGGESGWSEERVLQIEDIEKWQNKQLPIIFTATCSFGRWDDPEIISGGELSLIRKDAAAIALFTTTRIVFASYNFDLNQSFLRAMFDPSLFSRKISFGEVFRAAKNNNIGGLNINSRNFTLLGDPSTLFPLPVNKVITTAINNKSLTTADTLKAQQKVNIKGQINDESGNLKTDFNGFVYPVIFDKSSNITTLGQDVQTNGSFPQTFSTQNNIIYKGKATVKNGLFAYDFIVPKDINLQIGTGKINYYAENNSYDAAGNYSDIVIGGLESNSNNDVTGPEINLFLNDEKFVSGGITNTNPTLIINLKDESGINTTGIGIGHDVVATIAAEGKESSSIILNEFYRAKLDSYQEGTISYPIATLNPGLYSLKLKAWDVFNNSSEQIITFEVKNTEKLSLAHVLNYPNPFTVKTSFQFEHNHPNEDLDVQVNIFTISGKLIKTINQTIYATGNRVDAINWDGKDDFGDKVGGGVYVYELKVRSSMSGDIAKKIEKMVLLSTN